MNDIAGELSDGGRLGMDRHGQAPAGWARTATARRRQAGHGPPRPGAGRLGIAGAAFTAAFRHPLSRQQTGGVVSISESNQDAGPVFLRPFSLESTSSIQQA